MRIPFRCPVCQGSCLVSRPPYVAGDVDSWITSTTVVYECKACNGTGIVWSEEKSCVYEIGEISIAQDRKKESEEK